MNTKEAATDHHVHIIGRNDLQNELLKRFLAEETGIECTYGPDQDTLADGSDSPPAPGLVLYDCFGKDVKRLWADLEARGNPGTPEQQIAFFNLDPGFEDEKDFLDRGVRGVFHSNGPLSMIPKGVLAILNGEMWYSRKTLSARILEPERRPNTSAQAASSLTAREKEILIGIAAGHSNDDIASGLFISPHTVKTHVYNIYKKINISNRLQAMLWVAKYL